MGLLVGSIPDSLASASESGALEGVPQTPTRAVSAKFDNVSLRTDE